MVTVSDCACVGLNERDLYKHAARPALVQGMGLFISSRCESIGAR